MIKELRPENVSMIIIHCSDSPPGRGDTARTIHHWHLERGFDAIGYHRVILENGKIEHGRPDYAQGAHCRGYNWRSLSVCLIGRNKFSNPQYFALAKVLREWRKQFPDARIAGHYQIDPSKTCPGFDVPMWLMRNRFGYSAALPVNNETFPHNWG